MPTATRGSRPEWPWTPADSLGFLQPGIYAYFCHLIFQNAAKSSNLPTKETWHFKQGFVEHVSIGPSRDKVDSLVLRERAGVPLGTFLGQILPSEQLFLIAGRSALQLMNC